MKIKFGAVLVLLASGLTGFFFARWQEEHRRADVTSSALSVPATRKTFHSPATLVRQLEKDPEAGQKIFQVFCATCHGRVRTIDVPAPRIGESAFWHNPLRAGRHTLLKRTIAGSGAMPARGGCFECSETQLQQAIDYIIKNS